MTPSARQAISFTLLLSSFVTGCSKKGPECQMLIGSMNELGAKLTEAQKVTSNNDSKPEQVAAALRPFAAAAKETSDKLSRGELTIPEIKQIAARAAAAASALAVNATSMAEAADQMTGIDAAGRAVEGQKRLVDNAEGEIKKICDANAKECGELAKVLVTFPPPPEKTDNAQVMATWSAKIDPWAAELTKLSIKDHALAIQVTAIEKGWRNLAAAMTSLVKISETAKKYDDLAKAFNNQIDMTNLAITDANNFCKG